MKIALGITLPTELAGEFLQHIRDFDTKHDPEHKGIVHFVLLSVSDDSVTKLEEIVNKIEPGFAFRKTVKESSE